MLSLVLGWIPIIGPIIQGITGIFSKYMDTKVQLHQADATRDVAEAQVSAQIIHDTNDDICLRLLRDMIIFPIAIWTMLIGWDTIIAKTSWNVWMWHVADYPDGVKYIPYAVIVFLFGNIGINMFNRKSNG